MKVHFGPWWLLLSILAASALVALGSSVLGSSPRDRPSAEGADHAHMPVREPAEPNGQQAKLEPLSVGRRGDHTERHRDHVSEAGSNGAELGGPSTDVARRAVSEPTETSEAAADCSGALATDDACHRERYRGLVRGPGVEAAFAELKADSEKSELVRANCHQLVHVIGRAAAERYGDVSSTYARGDDFCWSGYYHGVMEGVVAQIGADKVLEQANALCGDLGGHPKYSFYHYDCVHGLGHGFMAVYEHKLFAALGACDALTDGWERDRCYGGVFMENTMARDHSGHPPEYLRGDQPLLELTRFGGESDQAAIAW
jgi:hypothetical protein